MSILSHMIAWGGKAKYWLSREYCYDEMEEKGYASQGRCCGLMGGDNWSDNTMYMCIDCPHYTPIIGGKHEAALKRELAPYEGNDFSQQMDVILAIVDAQPTADVVEVRHGRWLTTDAYPHHLYCSVCYKTYAKNAKWVNELDLPTNYCPNCGARMGKEDEHEAS